jgi:hypothetical protein
MALSRLHKRWIRSRKGYAGIIATIFMVLVVLYLYFGVFMFMQTQNVAFQDVTSQSQQLDNDRNTERIELSEVIYTQASQPSYYNIGLTIKNTGPIPVQIERIWVQSNEGECTNNAISPSIVLQPGGKTSQEFSFKMNSSSMNEVVFWLVTARGNLVSANALLSF